MNKYFTYSYQLSNLLGLQGRVTNYHTPWPAPESAGRWKGSGAAEMTMGVFTGMINNYIGGHVKGKNW